MINIFHPADQNKFFMKNFTYSEGISNRDTRKFALKELMHNAHDKNPRYAFFREYFVAFCPDSKNVEHPISKTLECNCN